VSFFKRTVCLRILFFCLSRDVHFSHDFQLQKTNFRTIRSSVRFSVRPATAADSSAEYMEKLPIANFDPKEPYIYPIGSHSAGKLMKNTPSWFSFRNYFYSRGYHKQPRKVISRSGLTNYQRNERPVFSASSDWRSATKWTLPRRTFTWFPAMTAAE